MMVIIGQFTLISLICAVSLASLVFAVKMAGETYFKAAPAAKRAGNQSSFAQAEYDKLAA